MGGQQRAGVTGHLDRKIDAVLHRQFIADQDIEIRLGEGVIGRPEPALGVHMVVDGQPQIIEVADRQIVVKLVKERVGIVGRQLSQMATGGGNHLRPQGVHSLPKAHAQQHPRMWDFIIKSSYFNFALLFLSCESKSSVLPTALAIFTSQIILIFLSSNKINEFKNILKLISKLILIVFGYLSLLIANKIIPLLTYISFKYELAEKFLTQSRSFASFQASAGRGWGGNKLTSIENTKNLLNNYLYGKDMVFVSFLLIKIILIIFCMNIIFNFIKYKKIRINLFGEKLTILICNLFILFSAWSFPLIFKFPYPRVIFVSISFTLLISISMGLTFSRQLKNN